MFKKWQKQIKHTLIWLDTKTYLLFMKQLIKHSVLSVLLCASFSVSSVQAQAPEHAMETITSLVDTLQSGKYSIVAKEKGEDFEQLIKAKSETDYTTSQTLSEFKGKGISTDNFTLEEKAELVHGYYYYTFSEDEESQYINILSNTTLDEEYSYIPENEKNVWVEQSEVTSHWADEYSFIQIIRSWLEDDFTTVKSYSVVYTTSSAIYEFELGDERSDLYSLKAKVRVFNNGRQVWNIARINTTDTTYSVKYKLKYKPSDITIESPIQ